MLTGDRQLLLRHADVIPRGRVFEAVGRKTAYLRSVNINQIRTPRAEYISSFLYYGLGDCGTPLLGVNCRCGNHYLTSVILTLLPELEPFS